MPSRRTTSPGPRHHRRRRRLPVLAAAVNIAWWLSTGCTEPPEDGRWHSRLGDHCSLMRWKMILSMGPPLWVVTVSKTMFVDHVVTDLQPDCGVAVDAPARPA